MTQLIMQKPNKAKSFLLSKPFAVMLLVLVLAFLISKLTIYAELVYLVFSMPNFDMTLTGRQVILAVVMSFIDGLWWTWIIWCCWENYVRTKQNS